MRLPVRTGQFWVYAPGWTYCSTSSQSSRMCNTSSATRPSYLIYINKVLWLNITRSLEAWCWRGGISCQCRIFSWPTCVAWSCRSNSKSCCNIPPLCTIPCMQLTLPTAPSGFQCSIGLSTVVGMVVGSNGLAVKHAMVVVQCLWSWVWRLGLLGRGLKRSVFFMGK